MPGTESNVCYPEQLIKNPFWDKQLWLRITYEVKPGIFDEKRGIAALLIKNSGFYFIFNPKPQLLVPKESLQQRASAPAFVG